MSGSQVMFHSIMQVSHKIRKMEQVALESGLEDRISAAEIYIIESIGPNGAERMRDIAQQLGVTLATLTVACDKLEQKGLVIRHRDRNDKRTVRVSLTEKGMVAYHFHCSFISALSDAMQEGMSPGEREALNRALEKLNLYFTEQE
jgi:DNA-binding MarR family transcriptional regulator